MEQNMDVLLVEPGKEPRRVMIPNTLDAVEKFLGGSVQVGCFLPQKVLLVSRETASGLIPNRCMPGSVKNYIKGAFLVCGMPEEGCYFDSLNPAQMEDFNRLFKKPGEFLSVGHVAYADPDDVADAVYALWDTMADGQTVTLTKWGGADSAKRVTA